MSLVAFGLRISAVRAIRAAIWPEFTVADSPQKPLDLIADGKPVVALYTSQVNDGFEGNEVLAGAPRVTLTIQIFLPALVYLTVAGQSRPFDTREEGAETLLNIVARRILSPLAVQAEPWAEMWARLSTRTRTVAEASYLVETDQVRTSACEVTLDCETLYEPVPGAPPAGVWADLIALMRTDTSPRSVAPLADWIAGEIAGSKTLSQDERDRIELGVSAYAAQAVSILPIVRGSEIDEVAVTVDRADGEQVIVPGSDAAP